MVESFVIALATLLIALYIQARRAAKVIRRNRAETDMVRVVSGRDR